MTKRMLAYWVIPPEAEAEFVAGMEDVLETYAQAYDPTHPVLCMDAQPVQLIRETRHPIPATTAHPARVDYEYERAAPRASLCLPNRLLVFGKPQLVRSARKWTGRWRWRIYSIHGMPTAMG